MKIVLIRPPEINRVWVGIPKFFNDDIFLFPPLGLMQLKAYIEENTHHKVIVYDSLIHKANYEDIAKFVSGVSAQVVGISTFTHSLVDVVNTAKAVKKLNPFVHIAIGGPHTYTFSEESEHLLDLDCIDSVVLGDGEFAFKTMLNALEKNEGFEAIEGIIYKNDGKIIKKGAPIFINELDNLPFPSRDIYGSRRYFTPASSGCLMTTVISSRGCPYSCKFCNVQKKYRSRSVKNIVDEMEECSKFGFKEIFFVDDTFNVTIERVIQLSEEILRRKLKVKWGFKARCDNVSRDMLKIAKEAGCFRTHYGVETGTSQGLDSINKRVTLDKVRYTIRETKRIGIRTTVYFIIGCPHEKDKSDILKTLNFASSLEADFAVFSLLSPYPDTLFYREGVEKGIFNAKGWDNFMKNPDREYRYVLPTAWEEHFSKAELLSFLKTAHRKFYYRPKIILNALAGMHGFTELKRILLGSLSLLKLELLRQSEGRI